MPMNVFLTNQKKLAAAAGVSEQHLSLIKKGANGISDDLAGKLETITQIKKITWASSKKSTQLNISLKKFFKEERLREVQALKQISNR